MSCRKTQESDDRPEPDAKSTRLSLGGPSSCETCFFCGESATNEPLCKASTFGVDFRVSQCAMKLQDKTLLARF